MTTKTIRTRADGVIPTLRVVGFHGQIGPDQTPARRSPIYADSKNHRITILESSPVRDRFDLTVEVAARVIPDRVWKDTGTRLHPPWPAVLGKFVVVIGEREIGRAHELTTLVAADQSERVTDVFRWLVTETDRSDQLQCTRVNGSVAWYCTRDEANALAGRIAALVRADVLEYARRSDFSALTRAAFWLSRAAVEDSDLFLSVAALRLAASPHWEALLEAGVRTGTRTSRLAAVDEAAKCLASPAQGDSLAADPRPPRSRAAQRAVIASVTNLTAAFQRLTSAPRAA
jgi:hypothetical protein